MIRGKQIFKSGRFLKASTILAHGGYLWLKKNLHDHEMGFCGESLYLKRSNDLIPIKESSISINKVDDYLYAADFRYYEGAKEVIMSGGLSGCSSFRLGDAVGRNLDWYYSEQPDFVITCHKPGCHKSIGIASYPRITTGIADGDGTDPYLVDLPWYTQDGINEKGLYVSHNVVPNDIPGGLTNAKPTGKVTATLDGRQVTRHILDSYSSVAEAVKDLGAHVKITCNADLKAKGYGIHWMLADASRTVVLEIVRGKLRVIESDALTNFWLYGVKFNSDGTVYTNADVLAGHMPTKANRITRRGSGLERWNMIKAAQNSDGDPRALLNSLMYSNTYTRTEDFWYSEFAGIEGVTVDTPPMDETLQQVISEAKRAYASRSRSTPQTWHTTHSVVYDLVARALSVVVQESGTVHTFAGAADA